MAILRFKILILLFIFFCVNFFSCEAAKVKDGQLVDADFTYKGIALHDDEAKVLKKLGKPIFTRERRIFGINVRYLEYKNNVSVGILERNKTVADIVIEDKRYKARKGVRYGATPHHIEKIYGKNMKTTLNGETVYIYARPNVKYENLILIMDTETNSLKSMRITRLPMTEEEADIMGEDPMLSKDLFVILAGEEEIDTSALKKPEPVKVRGLEK